MTAGSKIQEEKPYVHHIAERVQQLTIEQIFIFDYDSRAVVEAEVHNFAMKR